MQALHLSPAPPRPPLPTLRRWPVFSAVASAPAPKPHLSAPICAAGFGGISFYGAGRISLPRHLTVAAAGAEVAASTSPSEPSPLSAEDEPNAPSWFREHQRMSMENIGNGAMAVSFSATSSEEARRSQIPSARLVSWNEVAPWHSINTKEPYLSFDFVDTLPCPTKVSKKLEKTARNFKNLGTLGFWSQLVCTFVSAGILTFSAVATGDVTAPFTFCATAVGIIVAFISVFRSFGYIRLSERLKRTANEPSKAPPRANVVKSLRNSIVLNVVGMGAAVLGLQATVGALVAKALTTSSVPYYQGIPPGQRPVLALDIFLAQASANTILSHFLGLSSSLQLLRSVTSSETEAPQVPKPA